MKPEESEHERCAQDAFEHKRHHPRQWHVLDKDRHDWSACGKPKGAGHTIGEARVRSLVPSVKVDQGGTGRPQHEACRHPFTARARNNQRMESARANITADAMSPPSPNREHGSPADVVRNATHQQQRGQCRQCVHGVDQGQDHGGEVPTVFVHVVQRCRHR